MWTEKDRRYEFMLYDPTRMFLMEQVNNVLKECCIKLGDNISVEQLIERTASKNARYNLKDVQKWWTQSVKQFTMVKQQQQK